jgi:F-type H+-transporting ATPase subunit gamma
MTSTRALRRRIRSIQDTGKVCKAMEMIATARMRRAQQQAKVGRPYAEKIGQVIADLAAGAPVRETHPLLQQRDVEKIEIVHMATDRGLCGGLNTSLNHFVARFISDQKVPVTLVTVGRKGRDFMHHLGYDIRAEFSGIGDRPTLQETTPISRVVIDDYASGDVDLVYLAYPRFVNTAVQRPAVEVLLPVEPPRQALARATEYIYEPGLGSVLGDLLPRYVEVEVYHAILELIASEQSARMVAMRSASDNARELIAGLTMVLNKVRQETITEEICDISGAVEALAR